jgi:hypothetical protein
MGRRDANIVACGGMTVGEIAKNAASLPIRDPERLACLEDQFSDVSLCREFASNFLHLWAGRYARIDIATRHGKDEDLLDAVSRIQGAALMLGLARLAKLCDVMIWHVADRNRGAVLDMLPIVARCGHASMRNLSDTYLSR